MITVVSGTNRGGNVTSKVANYCLNYLSEKGVEVQLLDLTDLPDDFLFSSLYGKKNSEFESIMKKYVYDADKLVLISPEYNGSFTGILKAFIDGWNPKELSGQKIGLIGVAAGRAGNLRGLDHLTSIMNYLNLFVHPENVTIPTVGKSINEDGDFKDEAVEKFVNRTLDALSAF